MTALHSPTVEHTLCLDYVADVDRCVRSAHGDRQYELIVVERGTVQMEFDGHPACLTTRDAALVGPNAWYRGISGIAPALWIARFDPCDVDVRLPFGCARVHRLGERHEALCAVLRLLRSRRAQHPSRRRNAFACRPNRRRNLHEMIGTIESAPILAG